MDLTSYAFALFTLAVVVAYRLAPDHLRIHLLLIASLIFYASHSLLHTGVLLAVIALTFAAARKLERRPRAGPLGWAVALVLLPLLTIKLGDALWRWLVPASPDAPGIPALLLPLGISFFSLQAVSYLVDVHRGLAPRGLRFSEVSLSLAFFPKLLAGPIERADSLMPQLRRLSSLQGLNLYAGAKRAAWGLFCKLVVADNLARIVDQLFHKPSQESGLTLLVASVLYAWQIYFDFLGYTNIALGVARCFNISLNPNFRVPYAATSLRDFWRRWHISLSTWFRDYVYVPLGGRSVAGARWAGAVTVVFVLSGAWHGPTVNFLAWGLFHGAAYLIEHQARILFTRYGHVVAPLPQWTRRWGGRVATFGVVTCGWLLFRFEDMPSAFATLARLTAWQRDLSYAIVNPTLLRPDAVCFVVLLFGAIALDSSRTFRTALDRHPDTDRDIAVDLAYMNALLVPIVLLGDFGTRDFAYLSF